MSVSGEHLVSLLQSADQPLDQSEKIDDGSDSTLPTAGFTVKSRDDVGQKIFLNICSSSLVPLPPLWSQTSPSSSSPFSPSSPTPLTTLITTYLTAAPQNLNSMDPDSNKKAESALAIPLHLSSPPRSDVDHLGNTCTVLDCVINPVVLEATTHSRPLKMFLVQLALGETEKNLNRQVDPQFKLPKMKAKGDLALLDTSLMSQRRRESSKFLEGKEQLLEQEEENFEKGELRLPGAIVGENKQGQEESNNKVKKVVLLDKEEEKAARSARNIKNSSSQLPLPQMKNSVIQFEGTPKKATAAVVTLHLPSTYISPPTISSSSSNAKSIVDNSVQITSKIDSVSVIVPGCAPVHVQLPLAVDADKATAILSSLPRNEKKLTLTLPFASFEEVKKWI